MSQQPRQFTETYEPDQLIVGLTQTVTQMGTLAGGQSLPRGAVVGRITTSGRLTMSTAAASDGSQNPTGILADDYDATAGDLGNVSYFIEGEFNANRVTLGAGQTVDAIRDPLRALGIYLKTVVPAG